MQRIRRALSGWLGLTAVLGALLSPASAAAQATTSWTAGPGAVLDPTYSGFIDVPAQNATVPTGQFIVSGWFVDTQAQGWAGADDVQIWQGTMDSGKLITKALVAQTRADVASALGNPFWAASGFGAVLPASALSPGSQTLSAYVHTPGKGWWYKQVTVNVSSSAPAATTSPSAPTSPAAPAAAPAAPASPAPAAASAPAPGATGAALPIVVIEKPTSSENIPTHGDYTIIGYALDKSAAPNQGAQGSGIKLVEAYLDHDRDNGGTFLGNADLAFGDPAAQAAYGPQFTAAGWRVTFKPTQFHTGQHTLYVYAHSLVTGKENLATQSLNIADK
jgi:hypothetical protein